MDSISELYDLFGESAFCNICLEDCVEGQRVRNLTICNHIFHMKCLESCSSDNCSFCETKLERSFTIPQGDLSVYEMMPLKIYEAFQK